MTGRLGLCLVPLSAKVLDMTLTLAGQSGAYWNGDYAQVAEANPLMRWLLLRHPLAFVAVSLVGMLAYAALLWRLPNEMGRPVAFIIIFVHTVGAASWLMLGLGEFGYLGCLPVFYGAFWAIAWTWKQMAPDTAQVKTTPR